MKNALLFLCLTSFPLLAQKPKSYQVVTDGLVQKIVSTPASKAPISLAVVPFTATISSVQNSKAFGEYLTETIVGSLSGHSEKLRLFERTRMDAILSEHEFILTDLMKPAAALKIGQLAPIDALLSGTYTKLKSYIDISARLIDVTSGEIMMSYTGRIKMNKNLATLFQQPETATSTGTANPTTITTTPVNVTINNTITSGNAPATGKEDLCKQKVQAFQPRLHDLSTPEKISAVAQEAMSTPFDNHCGRLHYDVMNYFARYKIEQPAYKRFLLGTLDSIAYPTGDDRALEIIRYLASDGTVDDADWRAGLTCMARIGNYWLSSYVSQLLAKPAAASSVSQERINAYFALAGAGKLGLPRPVSFELAFIEIMEGLKSNQPLRQYVYQTYATRLATDEKTKPIIFGELTSMYKEEPAPQRKTEIINWLSDFININEYPKAHEQLYDFAWHFKLSPYEQYNEEKRRDYPEADLKILVAKSREKFSRYATLSPYTSQTDDRINFCVTYQIPVPGVIPTLAEAETILKGNDMEAQLKVMKLLALMGDQLRSLEPVLVTLFSKRSLEDRSKMEEIQTLAIRVLGNLPTADKKAIDYMLSVLPHYGNDTEEAKEALVKIGKPSVAPLIARLDKTTDQDGGLQFQLITLLGKIGKPAAPAEKSIQRVLALTRNSDVRYAAEAALQAIK